MVIADEFAEFLAAGPRWVDVPEGVGIQEAADAIGLCRRMGLVADLPPGRGLLLVPKGSFHRTPAGTIAMGGGGAAGGRSPGGLGGNGRAEPAPRYTLDEARQVLAERECRSDGHDLEQQNAFDGTTLVVFCSRCGATFKPQP